MKNFSVKVEGKTYWISRSIATAVHVFKVINSDLYVLAEKRGSGVQYPGLYCIVCGYLDYDETLQEGAIRELREETGINITEDRLNLVDIYSSPSENRQNVTVHYYTFLKENEDFDLTKAQGGEENEVEKIEWIKLGKIKHEDELQINTEVFSKYDWAFNHDRKIMKTLKMIYIINEE